MRPPRVTVALLQALRATLVSACLSALLLAESTGGEAPDEEDEAGTGAANAGGGAGTCIAARCGSYQRWLSTNGEMRVACGAADSLVGLVVEEEERREAEGGGGMEDWLDGGGGAGAEAGAGAGAGAGAASALGELLAWARTILLLHMAAEGLVEDAAENGPVSGEEAGGARPNPSASRALEAQAVLVLEAVGAVEAARRRRWSDRRAAAHGGQTASTSRHPGGGLLVLELADELCGLIGASSREVRVRIGRLLTNLRIRDCVTSLARGLRDARAETERGDTMDMGVEVGIGLPF